MAHPFLINILIIASCLTISFTSNAQVPAPNSGKATTNKTENNLQFDTSKTAIIVFEQKWGFPFDRSSKSTTLTQDDINSVDSLLVACVTDWNNSLGNEPEDWVSIDLKKNNYRKQLIVVTNKKGEKEVWVNCFCNNWDRNIWKTQITLPVDGGSCYFNFKINLSKKTFYDLRVNNY